jgi:pimeloyl-ACP methyl ester carboxylesterase
MTGEHAGALVRDWERRGHREVLAGHEVFVIDQPAAGTEDGPPLLVLHGFPTSSFDWRQVLPAISRHRRVLLLDFVGYGLSSKPDLRYTMAMQADVAQALVHSRGIERVSLVTNDMGDTVGGELLARSLEGDLPFEIHRRVITNGSIYIEMAQLSDGQLLLLSLPDERLPASFDPSGATFRAGLAAVFSTTHPARPDELDAQWALMHREGGDQLLPRLIRYIEERRANEARFTGAIEQHPSPLTIVWGDQDPIAVYPMAERLAAARPDATLLRLEGVGHLPMIEVPDVVANAIVAGT